MSITAFARETPEEKTARQRQERWDRQVAGFWHEYAPTPETQARLDAATLRARTSR